MTIHEGYAQIVFADRVDVLSTFWRNRWCGSRLSMRGWARLARWPPVDSPQARIRRGAVILEYRFIELTLGSLPAGRRRKCPAHSIVFVAAYSESCGAANHFAMFGTKRRGRKSQALRRVR